ncbi:MAG: NAD(P)-dependent oxidoreductase [Bacteroidota bacterium]
MKLLANDGIDETGKRMLEAAGFVVITQKVAQENLIEAINQEGYEALTVRSATKVRKELIDACPGLKLIGRGGVGMDNIDVDYAKSKGIAVYNTPAASSNSVAELVFAHLYAMCRFIYDSNRNMPSSGYTDFESLKKKYAAGVELRGKSIGIIGIGRIGQAVAQIALGSGMKVIAHDPYISQVDIKVNIYGVSTLPVVSINTVSMDELLASSDFISVHVPGGNLIGENEIAKMKKGVCLINASRGGVIDEAALINGLNSKHVAHAALDVFVNEPKPSEALLQHPQISLTPHIGAATNEAQERIGVELSELIIKHFRN